MTIQDGLLAQVQTIQSKIKYLSGEELAKAEQQIQLIWKILGNMEE